MIEPSGQNDGNSEIPYIILYFSESSEYLYGCTLQSDTLSDGDETAAILGTRTDFSQYNRWKNVRDEEGCGKFPIPCRSAKESALKDDKSR